MFRDLIKIDHHTKQTKCSFGTKIEIAYLNKIAVITNGMQENHRSFQRSPELKENIARSNSHLEGWQLDNSILLQFSLFSL